MFPAEAGGWRVGISKICKRSDLRPLVHSEWFKTRAEAEKQYQRITRKC